MLGVLATPSKERFREAWTVRQLSHDLFRRSFPEAISIVSGLFGAGAGTMTIMGAALHLRDHKGC